MRARASKNASSKKAPLVINFKPEDSPNPARGLATHAQNIDEVGESPVDRTQVAGLINIFVRHINEYDKDKDAARLQRNFKETLASREASIMQIPETTYEKILNTVIFLIRAFCNLFDWRAAGNTQETPLAKHLTGRNQFFEYPRKCGIASYEEAFKTALKNIKTIQEKLGRPPSSYASSNNMNK